MQTPAAGRPARTPGHLSLRDGVAVTLWAAVITVALAWGFALSQAGALPIDHFPPFHGRPRLLVTSLLPAAIAAAVAVSVLPSLAARLSWRALLLVGWLGTAGWAVVLAVSQGRDAIARPLARSTEYLAAVPAVGDRPLAWLRQFTEELPAYPIHVQGHPPLPVLCFWALDRLGLSGPGWAAAAVIIAGSSVTVAIAVTLRVLVGADAGRRAVPFLVLAPTAVFVATSADALFLGVTAWAVALFALAAARDSPAPRTRVAAGSPLPGAAPDPPSPEAVPVRPGGRPQHQGFMIGTGFPLRVSRLWTTRLRWTASVLARPLRPRPLVLGSAAGVLFGASLYLSYGLVPIGALALAVAALRPSVQAFVGAAAGASAVAGAVTAAGFWWPDGVAATHAAWAASGGAERPYGYFLLGNLAVLAVLTGPATAAALARLWRQPDRTPRTRTSRGLRVLVGGCLIAVLALDLSGVTKGEVERIWLPYASWIIAATAAAPAPARGWLIAQGVTAITVQSVLGSPW